MNNLAETDTKDLILKRKGEARNLGEEKKKKKKKKKKKFGICWNDKKVVFPREIKILGMD